MIEVISETGSTSGELAARVAAKESVEDGHWLVADRQSAGRGRQGRLWSDGAGNFMGSTLVCLHAGDPPAHTLSLVAGLATFAAIEGVARGIDKLSLKWPNDVLLGDAKLAGILLERCGDAVVVGIGVNLASAPDVPDRAVASLAGAGFMVSRDGFAAEIASHWSQSLELWRSGGWDRLRQEWTLRAHPLGTPIGVHGADGAVLRGAFAGLGDDGALQLQLPNGTRQIIHAGEVTLDRR